MGGVSIAYPILYQASETNFSSLGLGVLTDTISCIVTEERNGVFEIDMEYPSNGALFDKIANDRIIKCDSAYNLKDQLFRIVKISRPMNGVVSIYAQHISYLTSGLQLRPSVQVNRGNASEALHIWAENIITRHPFSVDSDISTRQSTAWTIQDMDNARDALGGKENSILETYGGEYMFDNYHIYLHAQRGNDNGVVIGYGKNLTDVTQEENIESTVTSIYPYCTLRGDDSNEQTLLTLDPPYYIDGPYTENYAYRNIETVDLSSDDITTKTQLRAAAENYIREQAIGIPQVNLKVSYVDLSKTLEYTDTKFFEQVNLCDIVTVHFEKLGIRTKAKVIRTEWDVLQDRYDSIEIGEPLQTLTSKINSLSLQVVGKVSVVKLMSEISSATAAITGNSGGYVALRPSKNPEEILICDDPDYTQAKNIWRWDKTGLSYSSTGFRGTYRTAMTSSGEIVADFITTGTLSSKNEVLKIDLNSALINLYNASKKLIMRMNANGLEVYDNGTQVGLISGSTWENTNYRGLQFGLHENNGSYIAFGKQGSPAGQGSSKLVYHNGDILNEGLHVGCDFFAKGLSLTGTAATFAANSSNLVHNYNNLDMHNYSVLNSSDARLKEHIQDTRVNALQVLNAIDLKEFDWIESGGHEKIGMIAQQLQEIEPDLVDANKDNGKLSIRMEKFIPYLIKGIQELSNGSSSVKASSECTQKWKDTIPMCEKETFIKNIKPQISNGCENTKSEEEL